MEDEIIKNNLTKVKQLLVEKDYDWLMAVCGLEGSGKSTCALQLCYEIDPDMFKRKTSIVTDLAGLKDAYRQAKKGDAILIDEGAQLFYNRNAMTKDVKEALQLLRGLRGLNLFVVVCMPDFKSLDPYIREHRLNAMVFIPKRGRAWWYSKRKIKKLANVQERHKKRVKPDYKSSFKDLPKELKEEYKKHKKEMMNRYLVEKKDKKSLGKKQLANKLFSEGMMDIESVTKIIDSTIDSVKRYKSEWKTAQKKKE
jgi:DNA-binding ferritin-like protein (Dps family)